MGHKNIALCIILVLSSSCAVGMRTHQTYASDPDGTVTKIGGGKASAKGDDGKAAQKESAPMALQTGGSNELYVAFARDTHSMDNAETSIEKRTPFVENGSAEMVGNPYGYGAGGYYDPVYAAAAAYTQSQMPGAVPASSTKASAEAESANEKADNAVAAQAVTAEEVAKQRAEIEKLKKKDAKKK